MISQQSETIKQTGSKLTFPLVDDSESARFHGVVEEACHRLRVPAERGLVAANGEWRLKAISASNARSALGDFHNLDTILSESQHVVCARISQGGDRAALKRLHDRLSHSRRELVEGFLSALSKADSPVEVLRELFVIGNCGLRPDMISAVLGIREEAVGGDLLRHASAERETLFGRGGFMYQPSEPHELWQIFSILNIKAGSLFVDLGSGYGHVVFQGAILRPDVRFKGIELMPVRVLECESVRDRLGIANLSLEAGDVTQGGFSDADIIFLFNPFPPDTRGAVAERVDQLAKNRPLAVLDYQGLATQDLSSVVSVGARDLAPYQLVCSRHFMAESCELVGFQPPQKVSRKTRG